MIPRPLRNFIEELHQATDSEKVSWQAGASDDSYFCTRKDLTMHIAYYFDYDEGVGIYHFRITGNNKDVNFNVDSHESSDYREFNNLWSSIQVNASSMTDMPANFFSDD